MAMQLKQPKVSLPGQNPADQPGAKQRQPQMGPPMVPPAPAGQLFQPLPSVPPQAMNQAQGELYKPNGIDLIIKKLLGGQ